MKDITIEHCSNEGYLAILENIEAFWGSDRTLSFHHPMFVNEFGDTAFVIKNNQEIIAYLFGFLSQTEKTGYVHLVGVKQGFQNKGYGSLLYKHFVQILKTKGCTQLKAITTATNQKSINFHLKIGMRMLGSENKDGVIVVKNYSGKGQDRVVFSMDI